MNHFINKAEVENPGLYKVIWSAVCCVLGGLFFYGCVAGTGTIVKVTEYGIFQADPVKEVKANGTSLNHLVTLGNIKLAQRTESVAANKGVRFGIRYSFDGAKDAVLTIKLRHPEMTNPATKKTSVVEQWQQKSKAGGLSYAGFTMDSEWEMVPGAWTFEVWDKDGKLAEKVFTVTKEAKMGQSRAE